MIRGNDISAVENEPYQKADYKENEFPYGLIMEYEKRY